MKSQVAWLFVYKLNASLKWVWTKRGLDHGLGDGLPCGLSHGLPYGLPVVDF